MARIHVTGASGSGTTTLGRGLGAALGCTHVDTDDLYWLPTAVPFTEKRPVPERLALGRERLGPGGWVLSGSLMEWGDPLVATADLIVLVQTPTPLRLERLRRRESRLFGTRIEPGGDMRAVHVDLMDWAARYDDPDFSGRSLARHESWLARQAAPALSVDGARPPETVLGEVLAALDRGGEDERR